MNNVHEDAPVVFQTRWVMSYLRGPLTRAQIKQLMDPVKSSQPEPAPETRPAATPAVAAKGRAAAPASARPALPPEVSQMFLPVRAAQTEGARLHYEPMLLGIAKVYYANAKVGVAAQKEVCLMAEFSDPPSRVDWDEAREAEVKESDLEKFPHDPDTSFGELPREASNAKSYPEWGTTFKEWIYRNKKLELFKSPSFGVVSDPGESERDFRIRLTQAAREKRDQQIERLRQKYVPKIGVLQDRIRRAEQAVEREKAQATQQKLSTAISFGATLLTALTGRKAVSQSTLGRAATTARSAGRTLKESQDIARADENVQALAKQLGDLQALLDQETEEVKASGDPLAENLEACEVRPKKTDISVSQVSLAWFPFWRDNKGGIAPAR